MHWLGLKAGTGANINNINGLPFKEVLFGICSGYQIFKCSTDPAYTSRCLPLSRYEVVLSLIEGTSLLPKLSGDQLFNLSELPWFVVSMNFMVNVIIKKETMHFLRIFIAVFIFMLYLIPNKGTIGAYLYIFCTLQAISQGRGDGTRSYPIRPQSSLPDVKNFVMFTIGSRGDVEPFIALGLELKRRKHRCAICTLEKHQKFVESFDISFLSCGIMDLANNDEVWLEATHVSEVMGSKASHTFRSLYCKLGTKLLLATKNAKAHVILANTATLSFALNIGEHLKLPVWSVKFAPDMPTRAFPPPGWVCESHILNVIAWYLHWFRIGMSSNASGISKLETKFRTETLGLNPLGGGKRLVELETTPSLCAYSASVFPKPKEWPLSATTTGWWFVEHDRSSCALSPDILAFLNKGKVICITFGSMTVAASHFKLLTKVLQGIAQASSVEPYVSDCRILIIDPTERALSLPNNCSSQEIKIIKEAPYEHVFKHVNVVIHHGGAGTCAQAILNAVPSIILPVMLWTDQSLWANQLCNLGAAICLDRRSDTLASDTSYAIARAVKKENYLTILSLQQKLQDEGNGVKKAAGIILGEID